jgi:hypothetical protein
MTVPRAPEAPLEKLLPFPHHFRRCLNAVLVPGTRPDKEQIHGLSLRSKSNVFSKSSRW